MPRHCLMNDDAIFAPPLASWPSKFLPSSDRSARSHPLNRCRRRTQSSRCFYKDCQHPKHGSVVTVGDVYFCAKFRLMCRKGALPSLLPSLPPSPNLAQRFLHLDNSWPFPVERETSIWRSHAHSAPLLRLIWGGAPT